MKFYLKTHLYNIKSCDNWSFFVYLCKALWRHAIFARHIESTKRYARLESEMWETSKASKRVWWFARIAWPLQGENHLTWLTRGDADALPRAMCFWAFSPRVKRSRDKSTDVTPDTNLYTIFQTKKRNRNVKVKSIHYLCNVLSCRAIQRYFVWTCSKCGWLWAWSERLFERNGI